MFLLVIPNDFSLGFTHEQTQRRRQQSIKANQRTQVQYSIYALFNMSYAVVVTVDCMFWLYLDYPSAKISQNFHCHPFSPQNIVIPTCNNSLNHSLIHIKPIHISDISTWMLANAESMGNGWMPVKHAKSTQPQQDDLARQEIPHAQFDTCCLYFISMYFRNKPRESTTNTSQSDI